MYRTLNSKGGVLSKTHIVDPDANKCKNFCRSSSVDSVGIDYFNVLVIPVVTFCRKCHELATKKVKEVIFDLQVELGRMYTIAGMLQKVDAKKKKELV